MLTWLSISAKLAIRDLSGTEIGLRGLRSPEHHMGCKIRPVHYRRDGRSKHNGTRYKFSMAAVPLSAPTLLYMSFHFFPFPE
jgi:hypothetical protein